MVSTLPGGRSPRPAGMAQLGYACFWPNGGGVKEGGILPKSTLENTGDGIDAPTQALDDARDEQTESPAHGTDEMKMAESS